MTPMVQAKTTATTAATAPAKPKRAALLRAPPVVPVEVGLTLDTELVRDVVKVVPGVPVPGLVVGVVVGVPVAGVVTLVALVAVPLRQELSVPLCTVNGAD